MSDFENKVVLVTGAGRGIGRAIAQAFAEQGAIIAANDINPINLDETISSITDQGGRAKDYVFDISKKIPVNSLVNQVIADWGRLDILVNNAAVRPREALLEMRDWDWLRTLDVNLSGPFYLLQAAGKIMRDQGGGAVVNLAATIDSQNSHQQAAFLVSKTGLVGLTRVAAQELARDHIRVNAICPTGMTAGRSAGQESTQTGKANADGQTQAIAALALFLCSPAASLISGQIIHVEGE